MRYPVISIVQPLGWGSRPSDYYRQIQARGRDGYTYHVPIDEESRRGVQEAEALARRFHELRDQK